ncbi:MAG: hypothetical protein JWM47_969 [Acidimicrobiales bacterium]|nr:hypothetical protein [Acidimicrobiales bacterium]
MTATAQAVGAPPSDRSVARRLAALLLATAGPVVLAIVSFDVPPTVGVVCIAASLALDRVGAASLVRRVAVLLAAGAACVAVGAALAGVWLVFGLALADWLVRGRPVPGLPVVHRTLAVPGVVLVAPWWALLALEQVGPVPFAFGFGLAVLGLAGLAVPVARRQRLLAVVGATYSAAAFAAAGSATARSTAAGVSTLRYASAGAVATLVATVLLARHTDDQRPWSATRHGPLTLAAPALVWLSTVTGLLVAAHARTSRRGYPAWEAYTSTLVEPVFGTLAATAVLAAILALLGMGAILSVRGTSALRSPVAFLVHALLWASVLAWAWAVPAP